MSKEELARTDASTFSVVDNGYCTSNPPPEEEKAEDES